MNKAPHYREAASVVLGFIEQHPEAHRQAQFWAVPWQTRINDENICDTTMCIAGTAVYLYKGIKGINRCLADGDWSLQARSLLGLTDDESDALFFTMDEDYATDMLRAVVAADEDKFWELHRQAEGLKKLL